MGIFSTLFGRRSDRAGQIGRHASPEKLLTEEQLVNEIRDEHIVRNEVADSFQVKVDQGLRFGSDAHRRLTAETNAAIQRLGDKKGKAAAELIARGAPAVEQIVAALLAFARSRQWHVRSVSRHDLDWQVRRGVGEDVGDVLAAIGDERAGRLLVAGLKDSDEDVRVTAAHALRSLRDPRTVGALVGALADHSKNVSIVVKSALEAVGGPEADASLASHSAKGP